MIKVSIVTVTYNCKTIIKETLENILQQDYCNKEVLIIDGNSTDGTLDVLNRITNKLDYFSSEPDKGIFDAMNKSLNHVTGDYVIFMNAGDRFVNNHIVSDIFNNYSGDDDLIYGDIYVQNDLGYILKKANAIYTHPHSIRDLVFYAQGFSHQSLFTKVEMLKKIRFNTTFQLGADYYTTWRIYEEGNHKIKYINKPISIFDDVHGGASHNRHSFQIVLAERLKMFSYHLTLSDRIKILRCECLSNIKYFLFCFFPTLTSLYRNRKRHYLKNIE
jgi:glycosyltransferase involved in cell wall biosynthesis